jgi:hypothetical protein
LGSEHYSFLLQRIAYPVYMYFMRNISLWSMLQLIYYFQEFDLVHSGPSH